MGLIGLIKWKGDENDEGLKETAMIRITDLQGKEHYVNAELIELVESTPDTQIVLTTGHRIFARESPTERSAPARRVMEWKDARQRPIRRIGPIRPKTPSTNGGRRGTAVETRGRTARPGLDVDGHSEA